MFVLTMHINEKFTEFLQSYKRHRLIIQIGFGAAIRIAFPANEDFVCLFKLMIRPPYLEGTLLGHIKGSIHGTFLGPLANLLRFEAISKQKSQRVENDRFARAGFPG